jgi:hypothetical protein
MTDIVKVELTTLREWRRFTFANPSQLASDLDVLIRATEDNIKSFREEVEADEMREIEDEIARDEEFG